MKNKLQGVLYMVLGLALAVFGFVVSGPTVENFWVWMLMPGIVFLAGSIMYGRPMAHCNHKWVAVRRSQSHDINLNIDRCSTCGQENHWLV